MKTTSPVKNFIPVVNEFYQSLLGYFPEQTKIEEVGSANWNTELDSKGLNPDCRGVYTPRNQTAIIPERNILSLFHEYFGHGLFCEQSLLGRELVVLEKKLLEEEKQEFSSRTFNLEDLTRFRRQSESFQKLTTLKNENMGQYELFAIWTEYLLSQRNGLGGDFEKKYDSLPGQNQETISSVIDFSKSYGELATFYAQGLARRTTPERTKRLLEEVYGKEKIRQSKLILLTGSKKPFSDIDLFASSNYLPAIKNDWLDLVAFNEKDFERRIQLFEIQVIHPVTQGEFIAGDKAYLEQKRKQLQTQPITEEAIRHNFERAEANKQFAEVTKDPEDYRVSISYYQTYLANALALKQGKRIFTKEELIPSTVKREQLKGGNEK